MGGLKNMGNINHRALGSTDIMVPALGVGTQVWGVKQWGFEKGYTSDDLFMTYKSLLDAGLNYFDTSESYGKGMSEQLLGEFHRKDGRSIIVGTKFTPFKLYDPTPNFSPKSVMPTLEGSLSRLGLDVIDLYQIHYVPTKHRLDDYLDALAETVKSGKVKALGVSNFNVKLLRYSYNYLVQHHNIKLASNQVGYSLINRTPETNGMLETCKELNVSLIALLPLAEGVLTGKYRLGNSKPPRMVSMILRVLQILEKQVTLSKLFTKPLSLQPEKLEPLFVVMDEIAKTHDASISQVALNWLISSNPLVIPIPGAKNVKQAMSNAATLSWDLSTEEFERISQAENGIRN